MCITIIIIVCYFDAYIMYNLPFIAVLSLQDPTMLELVDVLVGVACSDHTPSVTRQTALYSVKLLTRRLASKHHEHFVKVSLSKNGPMIV